MAGAKPKSKSSELNERVGRIADQLKLNGHFDNVAWQRVRKELESLESVPGQARMSLLLQAVMWELRLDRKKTFDLLSRFDREFGKDQNWYLTRANMAPAFGEISFVTEMLENCYPKNMKSDLGSVVEICHHSGMFLHAEQALDDLIRLDKAYAAEVESRIPIIREASRYIRHHNISEISVAERIVTAAKKVVDHSFLLSKYVVRVDEFGLSFEFVVDAEIAQLVELDLAISNVIASEFETTLSEHLVIGVTPREEAA